MKIVALNTSDRTGGAAIAANRLMKALIKNDIKIKTLVLIKETKDENVMTIQSSFLNRQLARIKFFWERWIIFVYNRFSRKNLFKVSIANTGFDIARLPLVKDADIIHIHWINQGLLSLRDLEKLAALGKPVVWTMHDQWAYTGICHYTSGCDKFINVCTFCPQLTCAKKHDLSYLVFKQKEKLYQSNAITFVGCSQWITNEAKRSNLCKKYNILSIPNPIDMKIFKVIDKLSARKNLGLPENKKLLLFGAANITDKRKGIYYLIDACNELIKQSLHSELGLVVFGHAKTEYKQLIKIPVYSMGYMTDPGEIVMLFNAVDLFVIPSLEENLPNTIMESMACGTPCVGFHVGGIPEMIDHKQNGYVAEYKNSKDLAEGIHWVLNKADYNELSTNARTKIESTYREDIVAKQYIELYKKIL